MADRSGSCIPGEFRTIDGTCNNTSSSLRAEWGASDISMYRSMEAEYGLPDPYNDMAGQDRVSPRAISNIVCAQNGTDIPSRFDLSSFVFTWGQFLDHDIDLTPEGETEYVPIEMPADEPLFTDAIPFLRSEVHEGTGEDSPREQTNLITSWIDASNVYGSEESRANWLRTFRDGKLKTSEGDLLPFNTIDGEYDSAIDPDAPSMAGDEGGTVKTFVAGDVRAAEQPGLTSLHTLFVREHNRICHRLRQQGLRDDELLYQRARKQVGAIIQAITYQEFLPTMGVRLPLYNGYKNTVQPDIGNLFATAAYRLGHTMVTKELLLIDNNCIDVGEGSVSLIEGFFNPEVVKENSIDPILKGLSIQVQQEIDAQIVDELRNFLFAIPGVGSFGLDLASLNIQRGRDHGLPNYNNVRAYFLGSPAQSFSDINSNPAIQQALATAYDGDIDNMDAWVGMLAERPLPGKSVGPTLHEILKQQFEHLRNGDFYYYEYDPHLSNQLRQQIRDTRLSDVIQRNTSLSSIADNVFLASPCNNNPPGGGGQGGGGQGGPGGGGGGQGGGGQGGGRSNSGTVSTADLIASQSSQLQEGQFLVSPNPTSDFLQINLKEEAMTTVHLQVISLNGQVLHQISSSNLAGFFQTDLSLGHLPKGVYLIQLQTSQQSYIQKLVLR